MSGLEIGIVRFKFGGLDKTAKCTIADALKIEAATGIGIMGLLRRVHAGELSTRDIIAVLRVGLASNGQHYDSDEDMLASMDYEGLLAASGAAAEIIVTVATISKAKAAKRKAVEGNGQAGKAKTSPQPTT